MNWPKILKFISIFYSIFWNIEKIENNSKYCFISKYWNTIQYFEIVYFNIAEIIALYWNIEIISKYWNRENIEIFQKIIQYFEIIAIAFRKIQYFEILLKYFWINSKIQANSKYWN